MLKVAQSELNDHFLIQQKFLLLIILFIILFLIFTSFHFESKLNDHFLFQQKSSIF